MNVNQLLQTMNTPSLSYEVRCQAAAQLWEIQNRISKKLKVFKTELSELSQDKGRDLCISCPSQKYLTLIEKQPPTPVVDTLNPEKVKEALGEDLFQQYIAHSHTIKWSEFRHASLETKERFYAIPGLEMKQTYQVKFKRTASV